MASSNSGKRMRSRALIHFSTSATATVPKSDEQRRAIRLVDVRKRQPDALQEMILAGARRGQCRAGS